MIGKIFLLASVAIAASANLPDSRQSQISKYECDPTGQTFRLLPHFTDCNKFFMCAHGLEVEFSCSSPELVFNFEQQDCVWAWQGACTLRGVSEEESDEGSGDGSGWDEDWLKNDAAPELIDDDVTAALSTGVHAQSDHEVAQLNCAVAHTSTRLAVYRGDCQRYWRCINGAAESVFCSDGLYFNPKSLQCDFEANVPCARDAEIIELGEEFLPI